MTSAPIDPSDGSVDKFRRFKDFAAGDVVAGQYELHGLLGAGAMGQVWLARHRLLGQMFAVKLATPEVVMLGQDGEDQATSFKRFENEARIAASLSRKSRHIVGVTDYGSDDGVHYLVMEPLQGVGLDQRVGDGRKLPPAKVATVVTQIAKGLTVAHAEGVIHRDLKPANLFLTRTEDGELVVKLLDFGIARISAREKRLTMDGVIVGSPSYMSPEQVMGAPADSRTDVWALAVVAFEALTGALPFEEETLAGTLRRICGLRATPLRALLAWAPDTLVAVFARAFAPNVADRFQTANDFAMALVLALPSTATQAARLGRRRRARRLVLGSTFGIAIAIALGVAYSLLPSRARPAEADHVELVKSPSVVAPPVARTAPNRVEDAVPEASAAPRIAPLAQAHVVVPPAPSAPPRPSGPLDRSAVF